LILRNIVEYPTCGDEIVSPLRILTVIFLAVVLASFTNARLNKINILEDADVGVIVIVSETTSDVDIVN
jgi:hypothetical protein